MTDTDVVVIGGGTIGVTIARDLAADHDVVLVERDQIAAEATGQASGIIQPQYQFAHLPRAGRMAFQFFEGLDGHRNYDYTERELINFHGPEKTEVAQEFTERISGGRGYDATWLSPEEIDDRYPDVFDLGEDSPIGGGMLYGRMGWIDPYTFATTMVQDATDRGADVRTGEAVTEVLVEDDEVVGVETEEETITADMVVAAGGWRTQQLLEEHVEMPIMPERFWHVNLKSPQGIEERVTEEYPQWYIDLGIGKETDVGDGRDEYLATFWRPEHNGELHLAGISGPLSSDPSYEDSVDEKFLQLVADRIPDLFPEFEGAEIVGDGVCPSGDAMSPDWLPIIDDPDDGPEGLIVATAFSGLGISASPVAAATVRELISGYGAPFSIETFSLARFEDRSPDFPEPPFAVFDMDVFEFGDWRDR